MLIHLSVVFKMDYSRIYEFLIFLLFQSFNISLIDTADLFRTIRYADEDSVNISCWNTTQIQIQNILVHEEETSCRQKPCVLNSEDTQTIEENCNGHNSCLVDYNFTSTCLRKLFRYANLSYTCKHENGTSVSTFEENFGDWIVASSDNITWKRKNLVYDHTRLGSDISTHGYSINAVSYLGTAGTARIDTDNEFMEPVCLSLWYQIFQNSYDCTFSIYKISQENRTSLFTADCNSTSVNQWFNISVDLYGKDPFKVVLEADFKYRDSSAVRAILVDDTSMAYRPCQENGTSVSTFEEDFGDWMMPLPSNNIPWERKALVKDRTRVHSHTSGYSIYAFSYGGNASTARIDSDKKIMETVCLSLWYQIYNHYDGCDCSLSIYKISDKNQTLLFTAEGNSTFYNQWINISVEVNGKGPFQIVLEAGFKHRDSSAVRAILVDDTSISYRPCQENGTSLSTFEDNFGDWIVASSDNTTWKRLHFVLDHTRLSLNTRGYSISAFSYNGRAGTSRIDTDNEFMEPICLSLWYQFYPNSFGCSFSIYKISDGNQTLLFTAEGNSKSLGQWKNISVDVYGKDPFKVALGADFRYRHLTAARVIMVDDTSIAYRPCRGQAIDTTCLDIETPIKIECETQFLADNIGISLEPKNLSSQLKNCTENSIERKLNTFCRNFNKSDQCEFSVLDYINRYEDCNAFSKHITITYQCSDIVPGSTKLSTQYYATGIAAGVSGGILITIISVVVIYRIRRSDGCDCVTKAITSLKRKGHESRINETGVYECSNISSRLSDHAYDSFECANYENMTHVPNSSTGGHHGND